MLSSQSYDHYPHLINIEGASKLLPKSPDKHAKTDHFHSPDTSVQLKIAMNIALRVRFMLHCQNKHL